MNPATRKFVNVGYGLALALLAANALLAYLDIRAIVRGNWWVEHTREVVAGLERAASTLKDAETGQRGYLLTGKDEYLKPYVNASNGLDKDLDRLFSLTADNPEQQARLAELRRIAGEKIAELGRTVALMRKGDREAALAEVQTDRGQRLMDRARALLAEMRAEEGRLLASRSAAASNAAWRAVASVVVATTLVASSLLIVSHFRRREDAEKGRAAEALRESEEWLVRMMHSIGDGVIATDRRGRVRLMNPVAQRLTGWSHDEAVGRPIEEVFVIVNEETRQPAENPVFRAIREGVVMGLANHTLLIARAGAETSIDDSAAPIKDRDGRVVGVVMVIQDATERRRHEAELRESEGRHRAILESVTDAFFALDRDWRFTYVNRRAEALLGRSRDGLVGKTLWQEYPETLGNDIERRYRRAMERGEAVEFDEFYPPHDRWYENHLYPSEDGLSVYFRDISERKRAEQEEARLTAASEQLRRIYETVLSSTPDFNYVFDLEGHFTYVNAALLGLWQKGLDEAVGRDFFDLGYPPELAARLQRQIQEVMETKQPVRDETPYTSHLGERMYEYIFVPVIGVGGEVEAVAGSTRDITERKRAEEALRESESRFRQLADTMPQIVWVTRPDGYHEYYNRRWYDYIGCTPEECHGHGWNAPLHPDDRQRSIDRWEFALRTGEPYEIEYRFRSKEGEYRWFLARALPVRDHDGRVVRWFGTCTDIEGMKRSEALLREGEARYRDAERALRANQERLLAALSASDTGTFRWEPETGDFLEFDDNLKGLFGLAPEHPIRATDDFFGRVHPEDRTGLEAAVDRSRRGEDFEMEFRVVLPDGCVRWLYDRGKMVRDGGGRPAYLVGACTDITKRKRVEEALQDADRRKDEFLATLAHELRNPLAPIRNALHLMKGAGGEGEGFEAERAMAERNVVHLTRLIDDLMDVARIGRGKIELQKEVVDLATIVLQAVETARPLIDGRLHELTVALPEGAIRVDADPTRLEQVLWNLLNNSAKYTGPGGQIRLGVEPDGDEAVVRVRDTGVGIEAEMLPRVFDMFVQVGEHRGHDQGGLGIGLSLVKTLVEMHGGSITASSDGPGKGSEFVVRLPLLVAAGPSVATDGDQRRGADGKPPRRRILVVDDNVDAARSLSRLLERLYGQDVRVAHDGPEALAVADEFLPHVLLLDIGLPGMDGNEVARRLRGRPEFREALVVALTGWGQDGDVARSREAGFDHHLVKPADPDIILELLTNHSGRTMNSGQDAR